MVDDGALLSSIDHLHGNKLSTEWEDIQCGPNTAILFKHLWNYFACTRKEEVTIKVNIEY